MIPVRTNDARVAYERAIEMDPSNPEGFLELGFFLDHMNEPKLARENFEKAIALGAGDEARHALAELMEELDAGA